jgi:predicted peptidase
MRRPCAAVVATIVMLLTCGCFNADPGRKINKSMPPNTGFVVREVTNKSGSHKYSVFVPHDYSPSRKYPAIVFLHGIGEAGGDGKKATTVGIGPAIARRKGEFPFIVVFPQAGWNWTTREAGQLVLDVIDDASKAYAIDRERVSLTGLSSGGKGTWVLGARYPNEWSALVPMGGYAAYDVVPALVKTKIPVWALHNSGDFIVPVGGTRGMIKKIKQAGGNPRYTEYGAVGHNCWDKAYDEGELFEWLQQQRRGVR